MDESLANPRSVSWSRPFDQLGPSPGSCLSGPVVVCTGRLACVLVLAIHQALKAHHLALVGAVEVHHGQKGVGSVGDFSDPGLFQSFQLTATAVSESVLISQHFLDLGSVTPVAFVVEGDQKADLVPALKDCTDFLEAFGVSLAAILFPFSPSLSSQSLHCVLQTTLPIAVGS